MQYIDTEADTVGEVLFQFEKQYLEKLPDYLKSKNKKHLTDQILVLLNGANVKNMESTATKLADGDEIQLSVPIIGG